MDTSALEVQTMEVAEEAMREKKHTPGQWESFLGGAVRISHCDNCQRFALAEVLPNGDDTNGNQTYKVDIRGSAILFECGAMPSVANRNTAKHSRAQQNKGELNEENRS